MTLLELLRAPELELADKQWGTPHVLQSRSLLALLSASPLRFLDGQEWMCGSMHKMALLKTVSMFDSLVCT